MHDIKWFPLWSSICRKKFGYGRIPASTAVVEAEFNNIKCKLFANVLPTRVDLFVFRHMDYINVRIKLVDAEPIVTSPNTEEKQKKTLEIDLTEDTYIASNKDSPRLHTDTPICFTCKSNDKSTSTQLCNCIVCNKFLHAFDGCSKVFDTENTQSTQRICTLCKNISKNDILNADSTNIPILRNGSNVNLKPVNVKGKKISVIQTCAFDSIFQIFLIMSFQSEDIKAMTTRYSNENLYINSENNSVNVIDVESVNIIMCNNHHWGSIKNIVYKTPPTSAEDMKNRITNVCRSIPQNILISTVENFEKRLRLCLQENGAPFEHLING
ncbi:hypothetical protein X777_11293 [Ooceraea biroi]|uniref:Uncharacterized protein n=1 Tax=Ooceraea biroi TaxID=2015173 RepID=A0A026W2H6_OOCBI|nr:hypothetical protein X777_11293 [Ooceraea biroi]